MHLGLMEFSRQIKLSPHHTCKMVRFLQTRKDKLSQKNTTLKDQSHSWLFQGKVKLDRVHISPTFAQKSITPNQDFIKKD